MKLSFLYKLRLNFITFSSPNLFCRLKKKKKPETHTQQPKSEWAPSLQVLGHKGVTDKMFFLNVSKFLNTVELTVWLSQ